MPTLCLLASVITACGIPDPGVEAGRSDRSRPDASPVTSVTEPADTIEIEPEPTDAEPTDAEPTDPEPTDAPAPTTTEPPPASSDEPASTDAAERPPAPPADGIGSVSADDLDSALLPVNPILLEAADVLTDGRDPQTFLDEEMIFSGLDPLIEIAGAPITFSSHSLFGPMFDADGNVTSAIGFRARYRMAVEIDIADDENGDAEAEALRDELRPIVEAANPGEIVTDTMGEAALGNPIFGLRVGPEDNPTTTVEVDQHYLIIPRPVNDSLLAVRVFRTTIGPDIVPSELPGRASFVDEPLQQQIDLFDEVPVPGSAPFVREHTESVVIPSAGAATTNRYVQYGVALPADGFDDYVASFSEVVEANSYNGVGSFGNEREYTHEETRLENKFTVRNGDDAAIVTIQGDTTAYPG